MLLPGCVGLNTPEEGHAIFRELSARPLRHGSTVETQGLVAVQAGLSTQGDLCWAVFAGQG
jgi:hypothetical protein